MRGAAGALVEREATAMCPVVEANVEIRYSVGYCGDDLGEQRGWRLHSVEKGIRHVTEIEITCPWADANNVCEHVSKPEEMDGVCAIIAMLVPTPISNIGELIRQGKLVKK